MDRRASIRGAMALLGGPLAAEADAQEYAKTLCLTIPPSVLVRADRVIE